jgi:hypothetical protein
VAPAVCVRRHRFEAEDVRGRQLRDGSLQRLVRVPAEHAECSAGRASEAVEGVRVEQVVRVVSPARKTERVDDGLGRRGGERDVFDAGRVRCRNAGREDHDQLAARRGSHGGEDRLQAGEQARWRGALFTRVGRGWRLGGRPLGAGHALRVAGHAGGVHGACGLALGRRVGIRARACRRLSDDLPEGGSDIGALGRQRRLGVARDGHTQDADAVVEAEPIDQRGGRLRRGALGAGLDRELVYDHEQAARRLGGEGERVGSAGLTPRGFYDGAGPAAHVPDPEHAPRLAVDGHGEAVRAKAVDELAVAIDHDDVNGGGGLGRRP